MAEVWRWKRTFWVAFHAARWTTRCNKQPSEFSFKTCLKGHGDENSSHSSRGLKIPRVILGDHVGMLSGETICTEHAKMKIAWRFAVLFAACKRRGF